MRLAALTGITATVVLAASGVAVASPTRVDYLVGLGQGVSQQLISSYGGRVAHAYRTVDAVSARLTAPQAARLAANPAVRYVERDAVTETTAATAVAWGPDRIDQRTLPLSKSYAAPSASGVTVYVIDSGIRVSHREFGGRASSGWDFVDGDGDANDCNGHGTHVAGTVGGATYGVAKDVKLVGVRVLDCKGKGVFSKIVAAVDWVTAHAAKPAVVNMSLGGGTSKALDDAVSRSVAAGITYVVSAGNDNKDACGQSPARTPVAITVGATDSKDTRGSFSNWGSCVDIFAPGVRIESASTGSNTATKTMSGTSMASPHVAGAAALVLGVTPNRTPAQVRDELVGRATAAVRNAGKNSPIRLLYTGYLETSDSATSRG